MFCFISFTEYETDEVNAAKLGKYSDMTNKSVEILKVYRRDDSLPKAVPA